MSDAFPSAETILKTGKTYAKDLTERVIWSGVAGVAAVVTAAGPANMLDLSFWQGAVTVGLVAATTLVKGLLARLVGDPNSASTSRGV